MMGCAVSRRGYGHQIGLSGVPLAGIVEQQSLTVCALPFAQPEILLLVILVPEPVNPFLSVAGGDVVHRKRQADGFPAAFLSAVIWREATVLYSLCFNVTGDIDVVPVVKADASGVTVAHHIVSLQSSLHHGSCISQEDGVGV